MFKIIIVAYIFGTMPIDTVQEFEMSKSYQTMEECKRELTLEKKPGYYDVITDFIAQFDYKYDWLAAGCYNPSTQEEYRIFPEYEPGEEPKGLYQIDIKRGIKV